MTTLIGIKANKGNKGVILASDLNVTRQTLVSQGDVNYKRETKYDAPKIYVDNKQNLAVCMSGVFDQQYMNFLSALLDGEIDFRKAMKENFFKELEGLNLQRWRGRIPQNDYMNSLLIATRFDGKPELYTCYPLGHVENIGYTSIGSGSDYAFGFISKQGKIIPGGISINEGMDLAIRGLEEAAQDIYTGGIGFVIVNGDGIKTYGTEIKKSMDDAKSRAIKRIKKQIGE